MLTGTKKYSDKLKPYVNDVLVFEENGPNATNVLPFFADGYPGIVFNQASNGLYLRPKNRRLSQLFLYGQTIEPIELCVEGTFKMIVFQMFPFAVRILLGIQPKMLNDDCYDLCQFSGSLDRKTVEKLNGTKSTDDQIDIISNFLNAIIDNSPLRPDKSILLALNLILQFKGKITITELRKKLFLTERTLERRFVKEIGVTPKMFCKIIQFQSSLNQISATEESRMMDVAYENGFADQSHFIRTFKKYTGITPSDFQDLPAIANFLPTYV